MSLRLHVALMLLLLPALLTAQATAPASKTIPQNAPSGGPYPVMSAAAQSRAKQVADMYTRGDLAGLWTLFSADLKKQWGTPANFTAANRRILAQVGTQKRVVQDSAFPDMVKPATFYVRVSEFSKVPTNVVLFTNITEQGEVATFRAAPEPKIPESPLASYKDAVKLKLPFTGEWFVYQGGRNIVTNSHVTDEDTQFQLDFALLHNYRPFKTDGSKNEDYYCFGQPILAPADGTAVKVVDGIADHDPGKPVSDALTQLGNYVMIAHSKNEISMFLRVKDGSINVKRDDKVKQGDVIAECGNSGASPAPLVQYRLLNSRGFPMPKTLPVQFVDYFADGKAVAQGEPARGQIVSNTAATSDAEAKK